MTRHCSGFRSANLECGPSISTSRFSFYELVGCRQSWPNGSPPRGERESSLRTVVARFHFRSHNGVSLRTEQTDFSDRKTASTRVESVHDCGAKFARQTTSAQLSIDSVGVSLFEAGSSVGRDVSSPLQGPYRPAAHGDAHRRAQPRLSISTANDWSNSGRAGVRDGPAFAVLVGRQQ